MTFASLSHRSEPEKLRTWVSPYAARRGCGTRLVTPYPSKRLRLRVRVVWSMASVSSSCLRFAQSCDRRENTGLSDPETARPQGIVVELRHHAGDQRVADTGRQAPPVLSSRQCGDLSTHGRHPTSDSRARQAIACRYIIFHVPD